MNNKNAIILPCLNEEKNIIKLIEKILLIPTGVDIVIINDGSTDNTLRLVSDLAKKHSRINIISHSKNLGLGKAIDTGFNYVLNNNYQYVITMDSDNTHSPVLIPKILKNLELGMDVVIASRYISNSNSTGIPLFRRILSFCAYSILKCVLPIKNVKDYSSGYRGYNVSILKNAYNLFGDKLIENSDFSCMFELIIKLHKINASFSEIPIIINYENKEDRSKINFIKTFKGYAKLLKNIRKQE